MRRADHARRWNTQREGDQECQPLDLRPSAPAYLRMLMILVVISGRDGGANFLSLCQCVVGVMLVVPMMSCAVRQCFAGDGEGDDREQRGCEQPGAQGTAHDAKLVEVPAQRERDPTT